MSGYHKKCNTSDNLSKKKAKKQSKKSLPPLTTKPFCDCEYCECKKCPDILKMLSITVTDTTCVFGSKAPKSNEVKCETSLQPQRQSVLDVLNPNRDCDCEVMARAIRSNIHKNLGLTEQREAVDRKISHSSNDQDSVK